MVAESGSGGVDSQVSWKTAWLVLAILSVSYAAPLFIVVGMKPMQEALGTDRAVLALAGSLVWVGTGSGGILMGLLADRIGVRRTVTIGACMIAAGLALSSLGSIWALYVGHALMGFLGNAAIYPPLLVYISRWFERRRGAAIALISSGQYVAGVLWPALFERAISAFGWQTLMLAYGGFALALILPATLFLKDQRLEVRQLEQTLGIRMERMEAKLDLSQDRERARSEMPPINSLPEARMVRLEGEVLQVQMEG